MIVACLPCRSGETEPGPVLLGYPPYPAPAPPDNRMEPVRDFRQCPRIISYAYGNVTAAQAERIARQFKEQGFNLVLSEGNRYLFRDRADQKMASAIVVLPLDDLIRNTKTMADACHQYGLRFFLHLTCTMVDQNLLQEHPDWGVIDIGTGKTLINGYGTATACLVNEEFMGEFFKRLERLIKESGADGIMQDEIQFFGPNLCGCRSCRAKFKKDTGFDIPDKPDGWVWHTTDQPSYAAWLEWRRAQVVANLQKVRALMKQYNPDGTVITYLCNNTTGYGYISAGLLVNDFPKYADSVGYECEPHDHFYQYYWPHVIYEMKYLRAIAENIGCAPWTLFYDRTLPDYTFNWFVGMSQDVRRWWYNRDPLATRAWEPQVAWEKKHAKLLINLQSAANIGVLFSLPSRDYAPKSYAGRGWMYGFSGTCNALTDGHVPYKVIVDEDLTAETLRRKVKTLLLLNTTCLSDAAVEAIRAFVKGGGVLVASGDVSLFDEKAKPRKDFALADVLGCSHAGEETKENVLVIGQANDATGQVTGELNHEYPFARLKSLAPDAQVVGRMKLKGGEEHPGILTRSYGQGRVLYFAGHPELKYFYHYYNTNLIKPGEFWKDERDPKYGQLLCRAARYANDELPMTVGNLPVGVVAEVYRHEVPDESAIGGVYQKLGLTGWVKSYRRRHRDLRGIQVHLANLLCGRLKEGIVPLVNEISFPEVKPNLPDPSQPITVSVRAEKVRNVYLLSPDFDATVELPFERKGGYATVSLPEFYRYSILYFSEGGNAEILKLNGGSAIQTIPPAKPLVMLDRNFMMNIERNEQAVTMWTSGTTIEVISKPKLPSNRSFVCVNGQGFLPFVQDLTREGQPGFMAYIPKKVEIVADKLDVKTVKMIFSLTDSEKETGKVYDDYELELQLEIRKGLPCLFLTSKVRNLGAKPFDCYTFWGWFHGENYTPAGGVPTPFKEYARMPKADWYFIKFMKSAAGEGLGIIPGPESWISDTPCSGALVYPEKSGSKLNPGETRDTSMVLFPAKGAEEAQAIFQQATKK